MTNPTEAPMANAIDDVNRVSDKELRSLRDHVGNGGGIDGPDTYAALTELRDRRAADASAGWRTDEQYGSVVYTDGKPLDEFASPSQHTGWSDEADTDRMQKISEVIAHLQSIQNRFGDTCVYIRRGGMSWGAVALNRRDDDKMNGVFDLQAQHDLDMTARLQQVQRLIDDNRELRTKAALAASSIAPATGFEVNDLVWERGVGNALYAYIWNERYSVHKHHGKFILIINSLREPEPFETEQAGIDAAQSHFSARILSSIAPQYRKRAGSHERRGQDHRKETDGSSGR